MSDTQMPWWKRPAVHAILLLTVFFGAISPTLAWLDFANGMENFNVITAMEMQRDGHWLLPTLNGAPRLQKPPLTQWITAWGIMSSDNLAWGARWPSLLMACLMLIAVYELGRTVGDWRLGLTSALVCGTMLFFLRYCRRASYDMQLAFWVAVANVFLARLVLQGRWWSGCVGAGAALGLALMTKGPPALIQTLLPVALFAGGQSLAGRFARCPLADSPAGARPQAPRHALAAITIGLVVMLAICLPWVIYVWVEYAHGDVAKLWHLWFNEVKLAEEAAAGDRNSPFVALVFLPLCLPWLLWLIVGLIALACDRGQPVTRGLLLMAFLLVIPSVIISLVPPVRDRYLLPMIAPAAVLAGSGVLWYLRTCGRPKSAASGSAAFSRAPYASSSFSSPSPGVPGEGKEDAACQGLWADPWASRLVPETWLAAVHWITLAVIAAGIPILGTFAIGGFRAADDKPLYSLATGLSFAAVALVLVAGSILAWRRWPAALVAGTVVVMLFTQATYFRGERFTSSERSVCKVPCQRLLQDYPDAMLYAVGPKLLPREMAIYMNRVVWPVPDLQSIPSADCPQLAILPEELLPADQTVGYRVLLSFKDHHQRWYALVRGHGLPG